MCPSSGADDCVMLQPRVGMCRGCRKVVKTGWQVVRPWMGSSNELDVTFCILYFSSNSCSICFGATMCPSSGADDMWLTVHRN